MLQRVPPVGLLLLAINRVIICWGNHQQTSDTMTLPMSYTSPSTYCAFTNRTTNRAGLNETILVCIKQTGSTMSFQYCSSGNGGSGFDNIPFNWMTVGY